LVISSQLPVFSSSFTAQNLLSYNNIGNEKL
jgi:hypothetical protein